MAAPKGNEYYLLRSKDGRDKEYTPEKLMLTANEYFQWCLDNPFKDQQLFHYQGQVTKENANKMRPFTLQGFCNFAEIVLQTFLNYEKSENKDFIEVTTRIRGIIENQQFEGAAAGFLNPNIIARKLGLSDRQDHTTNGKEITAQPIEIVLPDGKSLDDYDLNKK